MCGKRIDAVQTGALSALERDPHKCRNCWRMRSGARPTVEHYLDVPPGGVEWLWLVLQQGMRNDAHEFADRLEKRGAEFMRRLEFERGIEGRKSSLLYLLLGLLPREQSKLVGDWVVEKPAALELAEKATPVQCNGDAEPRRATGGALPGADASETG